MVDKKREKELLDSLYNAVISMDEDMAVKTSKEIIDEGIPINNAIENALTSAMNRVGELYDRQEYFVPEVLLCADAYYASFEVLKPYIPKIEGSSGKKRSLIIGVVEGDIHSIGKNLVKVMFQAAGWEVYDLGVNVELNRFVEEQKEKSADLIAISTLMTTSMVAIPKVIKMLKEVNPNIKVIVGGAPLNGNIAKSYGANGYADNAGLAVKEAERILSVQ